MNKACNQLLQRDVTDIGTLAAPCHTQFFTKCGFSLDKYNSVAMILRDDALIRTSSPPHVNSPDCSDSELMRAATKPSMISVLQVHTTLEM